MRFHSWLFSRNSQLANFHDLDGTHGENFETIKDNNGFYWNHFTIPITQKNTVSWLYWCDKPVPAYKNRKNRWGGSSIKPNSHHTCRLPSSHSTINQNEPFLVRWKNFVYFWCRNWFHWFLYILWPNQKKRGSEKDRMSVIRCVLELLDLGQPQEQDTQNSERSFVWR